MFLSGHYNLTKKNLNKITLKTFGILLLCIRESSPSIYYKRFFLVKVFYQKLLKRKKRERVSLRRHNVVLFA